MNRKEFLQNCACTLCTCAAAGMIAPAVAAADDKKSPEDWRFPFIKNRYAKLMNILADQMDEKALSEVLRQLGYHCASQYPLIQQHKGDIAGFIRDFEARSGEKITYDSGNGLVTVVSPARVDCYCPLVDRDRAPKIICNCSLGWQQYTDEVLLGKKVQVELKESVVRGGQRCIFQIHVLDQAV